MGAKTTYEPSGKQTKTGRFTTTVVPPVLLNPEIVVSPNHPIKRSCPIPVKGNKVDTLNAKRRKVTWEPEVLENGNSPVGPEVPVMQDEEVFQFSEQLEAEMISQAWLETQDPRSLIDSGVQLGLSSLRSFTGWRYCPHYDSGLGLCISGDDSVCHVCEGYAIVGPSAF